MIGSTLGRTSRGPDMETWTSPGPSVRPWGPFMGLEHDYRLWWRSLCQTNKPPSRSLEPPSLSENHIQFQGLWSFTWTVGGHVGMKQLSLLANSIDSCCLSCISKILRTKIEELGKT